MRGCHSKSTHSNFINMVVCWLVRWRYSTTSSSELQQTVSFTCWRINPDLRLRYRGAMAMWAATLRAAAGRWWPATSAPTIRSLMCIFRTNHICHSRSILRGQIKAYWYFMWPISTEHVANYTNFHIINVVWCRIRTPINFSSQISK